MSFIYDDILKSMGYFDPGKKFDTLDNVNFVTYLNGAVAPDSSTMIGYFPGSFAHWHDGHSAVIKEFERAIRLDSDLNYLIVVAPANSDYTVQKYGQNSLYATNKYRYDRIVSELEKLDIPIAVDLNPMLNADRDYNFTDLALDFVERQGLKWDNLKHVPFILAGKDRWDFRKVSEHSDKIRVWYTSNETGLSSSDYIAENPKPIQQKKLWIRCHNSAQYKIVKKFLGKYYSEIVPKYIEKEKEQLFKIASLFDYTICKDYADMFTYVPVHRQYVNPLMHSGFECDDPSLFKGANVCDSDSFTGSTVKFLKESGADHVETVWDLRNCQDDVELLDFDDFADGKYVYPHVDVSSRCSLPAFTKDDHIWYNEFIEFAGRYRGRKA